MHETQRNAQDFNAAAALSAERAHGERERGLRDQRITALERALEAIRSDIDGMADVEDRPDGEGVRPNVFMRIDALIDAVMPLHRQRHGPL
jgi:hypothetical protein